ncbi:EAL domain-containing protein [Colwellia sp. RSH04]|uniref:sensor domain-containing protein n=1 Tax=Colwellia sp. RSH04 TaxID=2305464 RepID=UPI000E582914|nr:EAL domain-containing protein [Colwellia sp. RSH04]RHW76659.1 EAL domain-containing protein [Colwellia sp. RSH04]
MSFFDKTALQEISTGIVTLDKNYIIIDVNEQFLEMTQFLHSELLDKYVDVLTCHLSQQLEISLKSSDFGHFHTCFVKKDNSKFSVEVSYFTQVQNNESCIILIVNNVSFIDVTKSKLSIIEQIFDHSNEAIVVTDKHGNILTVNNSFYKITGYQPSEVIGKTPAILNSGRQEKAFYQDFWSQLKKQGEWQGEIWNKRKNGEIYPEWLSISSIRDENEEITNYIAQFTDISARKKTREEELFHAYHDPLTSLPNRNLLFERLRNLCEVGKETNERFAVLFCDLDRFKFINDSMGHEVGDELLKHVADRLHAKLRDNDLIARLGGDEFIVIIDGEKAIKNVDKICLQIMSLFEKPFDTKYGEFKVTMSIGISQYPADSEDIRELISFADTAMLKVKEQGGNHFLLFDTKEKRAITQRLELESEISNAIKNQNFEVWYQPQIDAKKKHVYGIECLLRWRHPTQGIISPDLFIPIAEANGAIKELGLFVLKTACHQLREWRISNVFTGVMAINVSLRQFDRNDLLSQVRDVLIEEMLPGDAIELEVTESVFSEGNSLHNPILSAIRGLGVKIAIDDFGTGYSSLQRLKNLPIDNVKIDKCFIDKIVHSKQDAAIVKALILLSKTFNVELIAEGVETQQQADKLIQLGCYNQQGYLYSKPLPASEFEQWLIQFNARTDTHCKDSE